MVAETDIAGAERPVFVVVAIPDTHLWVVDEVAKGMLR